MRVSELSTPAIVVDIDVVESNLHRMAEYCRSHGIQLRPHTKTHKTLEVARMQLDLGAIGLTVAKVGEAEVMVDSGARQILVAHPIFGDDKLRRLAKLTARAEIIVAVDSFRAAESLSRIAEECRCTFGVLIEFDSGSHRCGVAAGEQCAELGKAVANLSSLQLRGLFTYFGSVWGSEAERHAEIQKIRQAVSKTIEMFQAAGLSLEIVSAGSTPAAELSHLVPGITEIRPGTYVYNDLNSLYQGLCTTDQCAVRVVTTVVSTAVPEQVIIDAGSKTFSSDRLSAGPESGFGQIDGQNGMVIAKLNEEHGFIPVSSSGPFQVGDVVTVIPNHVCTCVNMHDQVFVARKGEVLGTWRVAARGKVC
jgi:D-serine deaminase-like pyridoxal phosphate-dependent protein